jgi:hypothetical protein
MRDVVLGWEENGTMTEFPVVLINVSLHGCQAKSARSPKPKRSDSIWFKVPDFQDEHWVEGILIEAQKPFFGPCTIRVKFLEPLHYSAFKYLVYGPEPPWVRSTQEEVEMDQLWR